MFPGVEVRNPPNVTNSDPLIDVDFKRFVTACGVILLVFGAAICVISILCFVAIRRKSWSLTMPVSMIYMMSEKCQIRHICLKLKIFTLYLETELRL